MRIGVLGGGQLGRMLALAGRPLGLRFRFLEPAPDPPVAELGEVVRAPYDDEDALRRFADGVDVVTFEFENVPERAPALLASHVTVRPSATALACARDRLHERQCLESAGIPVSPHRRVDGVADIEEAASELGLPVVLKTRCLGYDGKGQAILRNAAEAEACWKGPLRTSPSIAERFVPFRRELSTVAVRGADGEVRFYPLVQNTHQEGILVETLAPAPDLSPTLAETARTHVRRLMESLEYVGVLAVEWFETADGLVANEIAPRVHNSGHWTQDGAVTSQFENHVRAVAGLPLGSTEARPGCVTTMTNLIGALPDLATVLAEPGAHVHLYEKAPRPGRKLGHVNRVRPEVP